MEYYDDFYDGLKENRSILYRQIDTVAILNKLLATICSELHNLKNYKINIIGDNSYVYKEYLSKLINKLNEYDNKIQELIKIKGGFPLYQLGDIETISIIKTIPSMDYKSITVINNINNELKIIKKLIKEAIESSSKENDYSSIVLLSNLLYIIDKTLHHMPL